MTAFPRIADYTIEAELGRGGMGVVYKARRESDGRVLALKMILCLRRPTTAELIRFRLEAQALACLKHPHIICVRDIGVWQGTPYFALDYAEKGPLNRHLNREAKDPVWAAGLVRRVAGALHYAHGRGVIHRDLKPANILIRDDGVPVVTDFGLVKFTPVATERNMTVTMPGLNDWFPDRSARDLATEVAGKYPSLADRDEFPDEAKAIRSAIGDARTRSALDHDPFLTVTVHQFLNDFRMGDGSPEFLHHETRAGAVMGTPTYMAPEQAAWDPAGVGPPADIYALGGLLYEALTGRTPVELLSTDGLLQIVTKITTQRPVPPRRISPAVPAALEDVCLRCLEKKPGDRFPSAGAVEDALTRFLAGVTTTVGDFLEPVSGSNSLE